MGNFRFGKRSEDNLIGVHPDLEKVVRRALRNSPVDFAVIEGMRTLDRQKELVAKGASRTMNSRHLTGHAVDLVPYIDGRISWDWPPIYQIAEAMRLAAHEFDVHVTWGAAWHAHLFEKPITARALSNEYVDLRRRQGRTPFMDGPHFELSRADYP